MNNPHVKTVYYRIIPSKSVDYKNSPPFEETTDEFKLSIDGNLAIFQMKKHYSTIDEAKIIIEDYLHTWEVLIGIEHDPEELSFSYKNADIIDLSPELNEKKVIKLQASVSEQITISESVTIRISRGKYPSRPNRFVVSPDVETMYIRYRAFRQNRESLTSMAYMCLTVLEASASNRKDAAKKYCIDYEVLNKLGELSSTKGDAMEARKVPKNGKFKTLNQQEKNWIVSVIKMLIRRTGEYAYAPGNRFKQITMKDFPNI